MKFWQKIFFSTVLVFVMVFDIGILILTNYSYQFSLKQEEENAIREHSVILSSVETGINNAEKLLEGASKSNEYLFSVVKPLANYYSGQGIKLNLRNEINEDLYSDEINFGKELYYFKEGLNTNIVTKKIDDTRYIIVATKVPHYNHLTFVYAKNINQLDLYRQEMSRVFIWLNLSAILLTGIVIFLILKQMTHPIKKLNEMTSEIASGAYNKRVQIKNKDELGELATTFNRMADSVEENFNRLTLSAEEKQQFIDNLTHEMKTPLTAILGYSEFLQNAKASGKERIAAITHLHEAAQRLNNLSTKLLDMTLLKHEEFAKSKVNLTEIFNNLENMSRPILNERAQSLEITYDENSCSCEILGDETLLLSLFSNLVENASRASAPGDKIEVTVTQTAPADEHTSRIGRCTVGNAHSLGKQQALVVEVKDYGCGMEKDEIKKITEPFYRVDKSRSRESGGMGLGMSICRQIVELHNAKMAIYSEPCKGTTVKIVFTTV